jgi:hypothetical protein
MTPQVGNDAFDSAKHGTLTSGANPMHGSCPQETSTKSNAGRADRCTLGGHVYETCTVAGEPAARRPSGAVAGLERRTG